MVFGSPQAAVAAAGRDAAIRRFELGRRHLPGGAAGAGRPRGHAVHGAAVAGRNRLRQHLRRRPAAGGDGRPSRASCCTSTSRRCASEPTPPTELIRRHGRHAGHFHANDANRRGPGFRRRRLRADLSGAAGCRLRPVGLGRGVRLHAGSRDDCDAQHRLHDARDLQPPDIEPDRRLATVPPSRIQRLSPAPLGCARTSVFRAAAGPLFPAPRSAPPCQ